MNNTQFNKLLEQFSTFSSSITKTMLDMQKSIDTIIVQLNKIDSNASETKESSLTEKLPEVKPEYSLPSEGDLEIANRKTQFARLCNDLAKTKYKNTWREKNIQNLIRNTIFRYVESKTGISCFNTATGISSWTGKPKSALEVLCENDYLWDNALAFFSEASE